MRSPPRLPHGVRDHLPDEASRRGLLRAGIASVFDRAGYQVVETPLYERDEVFALGAAATSGPLASSPPSAVRFSDPRSAGSSAEVLALRVDFTPQIARLWASRLHEGPGPQRLRYEGSVVRLGEVLAGTPSELYQIGVELIGEAAPAGDLELLRLLEAALARVGLGHASLDLGHAGFVRAALAPVLPRLDDPRPLLEALRHADERAVAAAVARLVDGRARRLVAALPALRGGIEVLDEARRLASHDRVAKAAVQELAAIVSALPRTRSAARTPPLTIDLGEVRGLAYYTGARFSAYSSGVGRAIAVGGRYDELLTRFGRPAPAAGFAFELDALFATAHTLSRSPNAPLQDKVR